MLSVQVENRGHVVALKKNVIKATTVAILLASSAYLDIQTGRPKVQGYQLRVLVACRAFGPDGYCSR